MKKLVASALCAVSLFGAGPAAAFYPWRDHAAPFAYLFGNDIDTHQQSTLKQDGTLSGYFYVQFTGVVTRDGYPVATHANCNAGSCSVGWTLDGEPGMATLLYQVDDDHPIFLVSHPDIPQPGAYAHFHWVGGGMPAIGTAATGYLLQLTAVDSFCFIHHEASAAQNSRTCRENGGVAVNRGIDIATHLNIVPSFP